MPLMGKAVEAAQASRLAAEASAEALTAVEAKAKAEAEAAAGIMVLAAAQAAAEIEAASVLKAAAEAAAAEAKVAIKQTKAEVKAAKAKAKAEAEAIVTAKHSSYMKEKAAAEAAVIAEVRARKCPVAVAEEQCLDSKGLKEAVTAGCSVPAEDVGRSATLRAFGLGHYPAAGSFDGGYVGNLVRACFRLRELEAFENFDSRGEIRSAKARSTARDATQREAEKVIFLQEKIRYLTQVHLEVAKRLPREMAKIRKDSAANERWHDAYDIVIKFLSELWVDVEATAASKDASISRGPAEEALPADSAAAATVMSTLPMPAPKTRPRLQYYDEKEERYDAMCKADPAYKARHEAWVLEQEQWPDEDEDCGDDGDGASSCSGGEYESDQ